ncbi:MAG: phage tail tape measure protein, partial [Enterocloster bolteae]
MAGRKEYELAIKIAGMVDASLGQSCNLTKKQINSIAREAARASNTTVGFADAMTKAGPGIDAAWDGAKKAVMTTAAAMAAAGAAVGVVGGMAISAGSDFESAFAGVRKTVDATEEQFAELEDKLRDMAKNKPQTAVELAEIAEAAGQLGIHTENIAEFTDVMADLKVATNLGDEGASQFAKFANIVDMSQEKFANLGSTVVALGNNMATTEADIVEMGMRLAGAGKQVGMSEGDIMGFAAALSSVGIEAEAGGSAMSKMMVNMQLAVETGADAWAEIDASMERTGHTREQAEHAVAEGGKALNNFAASVGWNAKQLKASVKEAQDSAGSLQDFADVANMTSEEFANAFKDNAAGALSAFISGLNDTERLGQSAIVTLDSMDIKEVRLRDTLLRAANASGLFNDALTLANNSFDENTALTKEAEQRYKTFESRLDMVKNRITDVGISLYQDFRDPLSDCLDIALDFTNDASLFDGKFMEGMAKEFKKNIPTIVRELGEAKDSITEFAEPLLRVGGWMMEHPDVIAGGLAAIGTTITTMKVVKTITDTAGAMDALRVAMMSNPVTAAISVAAIAGGAIMGVATKVKMANAEMKKQNLANHFGDISLSLGELKDAAEQIIGEDVLNQLGKAMEEIGKVSDIADDISASSEAINKLTWKVGMGLQLSETEQGQFDDAINNMIDNSIALVEQAQYTAHLNVNALFGEGDETGQELIAGFDAMYQSINGDIAALGKQLGEAYNGAMEDGVIDTDEAKLIQELQAQLARVTDQVAQSQLDAKLERIRVEYTGKELDADTFRNLQKEIQDQITEAKSALSQSYEYNLGALNLRLTRSQSGDIGKDDAAYITQQMYDELKESLDSELSENRMELELKGLNFQTQSISDAYQDALNEAMPDIESGINEVTKNAVTMLKEGYNDTITWDSDTVLAALGIKDIDKVSRKVIEDLWKDMEPNYAELQKQAQGYLAAGKAVPQSIADGLADASAIGAIAGNQEAIWQLIALSISENGEYKKTIDEARKGGAKIPEEIAVYIDNNANIVDDAIIRLSNEAENTLQSRFGKMQVYGTVDFNQDVGSVTTRP